MGRSSSRCLHESASRNRYVRQRAEGLARTPEIAAQRIVDAAGLFAPPPQGYRRVGCGTDVQPDKRMPVLLRWMAWTEDREVLARPTSAPPAP